jgi:hypothetical protein
MKNNNAINIMTYNNHFDYTYNLILELQLKNIDIIKCDIFIIFEDIISYNSFKNKYINIFNNNIKYLIISEILKNKFKYLYNETYEDIHKQMLIKPFIQRWGASGYRYWVAIKRTYSILELYRLNYKYIWCLDAESFPLKKFSINNIFQTYINNPYLLVSETGGWNANTILLNLFKYNKNDENVIKTLKCGLRQNDFWIINTDYYNQLIIELNNIHNKPISYYMLGSEQAVYESWLYYNKLKSNINLEIISFNNNTFNIKLNNFDMHGNNLFMNICNNPDIDIHNFANIINKLYFNKTNSYRGGYMKNIINYNNRGKQLIELLNIKIAVSNYQGN